MSQDHSSTTTVTAAIEGYFPYGNVAQIKLQDTGRILTVKVEAEPCLRDLVNKLFLQQLVDADLEPRTPNPRAEEPERSVTHAILDFRPHMPPGHQPPELRWRRQGDTILAHATLRTRYQGRAAAFGMELRIRPENHWQHGTQWITDLSVSREFTALLGDVFRAHNFQGPGEATDSMTHPSLEQAVQYAELMAVMTAQELERETGRREAQRQAAIGEIAAYLEMPIPDAPNPSQSLRDVHAADGDAAAPNPAQHIHDVYAAEGEAAALRALLESRPRITRNGPVTTCHLPHNGQITHNAATRTYEFQWPGNRRTSAEKSAPLHDWPDDHTIKTYALHKLAAAHDPEAWEPLDPAMLDFPGELLHCRELDDAVRLAMAEQTRHDQGLTELLAEAAWSAANNALDLLPPDHRTELIRRLSQCEFE